MKTKTTQALRSAAQYAFAAVRWLPAAAIVGLLGGAVGAAFHPASGWRRHSGTPMTG